MKIAIIFVDSLIKCIMSKWLPFRRLLNIRQNEWLPLVCVCVENLFSAIYACTWRCIILVAFDLIWKNILLWNGIARFRLVSDVGYLDYSHRTFWALKSSIPKSILAITKSEVFLTGSKFANGSHNLQRVCVCVQREIHKQFSIELNIYILCTIWIERILFDQYKLNFHRIALIEANDPKDA